MPKVPTRLTFENDVIKIMDDLELKSEFVGLSMGGMTLGLALKHHKDLINLSYKVRHTPSWNQRIAVVEENDTAGVINGSLKKEEFRKNPANSDVINLLKR